MEKEIQTFLDLDYTGVPLRCYKSVTREITILKRTTNLEESFIDLPTRIVGQSHRIYSKVIFPNTDWDYYRNKLNFLE